ncbi:MAG TPA: lipopolysaccharide heptosyltransferase II [Chthoniobacterales bacterium]
MSRLRASEWMDLFVYGIYRAVALVLNRLPLAWTFRLGQALGWVAYAGAGRYRRIAAANVRIAFPTWNPVEVKRCVRRHFQTLFANLLCSLPLAQMPWEEVRRHLDLTSFEARMPEINSQKGVIWVLNHIGNWELMVHAAHFFRPGRHGAIYQPLRNRWLDAFIRRSRESVGIELIDRSAGLNRALGILREGGNLGILVDQHAGDHGVWTPFFDRLASTTPFPAILAKKTGATLLPAAVYTVGVARWRIALEPYIAHQGASSEEVTARTNQALATQIQRAPADWFWVHRRWKTPAPQFLLRNYKRGVYVPAGASLSPFRILVRSSNWLGDAVMTVPTVCAIKAGRPDARVTVLTKGKLVDLWESVAAVDEVLPIEKREGVWAVARKLRGRGFDAAVLLPNSPRSGLEVWLAGIPRRVGYARPWRTWCLNQIIPEPAKPGPVRHQSEHYLRIADRIGANLQDAVLPPRKRQPMRRVLGVCPGAEYGPAKRWPGFAEAAKFLSERHGWRWMILGTGKDREAARQIVEAVGDNALNLTGRTTLGELMEMLVRCELLLTNDTGTMHLAAYLGVPTVAVFGSTEPTLTGPMGAGHVVIRRHVECSPCFLRKCPIDFRCMREVTVEEVTAVIEKMTLRRGRPWKKGLEPPPWAGC